MIIHIISRGKKWAVRKQGAKRAERLFDYREEAYYYARYHYGFNIVVHNSDGTVFFRYGCEGIE